MDFDFGIIGGGPAGMMAAITAAKSGNQVILLEKNKVALKRRITLNFTFKDKYDRATILKWMRTFFWRFFTQQFKRSASPDGPKVGGVSLSAKKVKGGMGLNLGIGIALSFGYIVFQTISSTFAVNGSTPPIVAVWIPNIAFLIIGIYLYGKASK